MNLLGKILTMLILIMSLVFMSLSMAVFATHRDWKTVVMDPADGLAFLLKQAKEVNQDLRAEIDRLTKGIATERAARVEALARLESKLIEAQQQLTQTESQLATLTSTLSVAVDTMESTEQTLVAATEEVEQLRGEIRDAQEDRNTIFSAVVVLTDDLNQATGLEESLHERQTTLVAQITRQKKVMDKMGVDEFTPVAHIPPKLDGVIKAVSKNLVETTLGSDDGLRVGHLMDVFRNASYLGRVRVVKTSANQSVAEVLKEFQRGVPMQKDDRVRTKIN